MQKHWSNPNIVEWCQYLLNSYVYWTKNELLKRDGTPLTQAERLFDYSQIVVSHGIQIDPVLNFGNRAALRLWEMDWEQFTRTPSRLTAEPMNREERSRMLAQAQNQGYISDYRGIRISSTGKRFLINQAIIWTVQDTNGATVGQAATFSDWQLLND